MRLWYQSFSKFDALGKDKDALQDVVRQAADPGTEVHVHDLRRGGGIADQYRYLEHRDVGEVIDNGLAAQKAGYDAFLIGNIADPGIRELREVLTIPVIGLCETSLSIACMMGASFTLVCVNDKFVPRVLENVQRYGFTGRMASIERMTVDRLPDLAPGFSAAQSDSAAREAMFRGFAQAARPGIAKGAEVVIAAGGVVMVMLEKAGIHDVDGVPILNGTVALTKMGEMAVKLARLQGGAFQSKRMTYAPPRGALLREIRAAYGPDVYPGVE